MGNVLHLKNSSFPFLSTSHLSASAASQEPRAHTVYPGHSGWDLSLNGCTPVPGSLVRVCRALLSAEGPPCILWGLSVS